MITFTSPTISVIICTYNRHESLQRAINSVLMQDRQDFEIIIIDDGSEQPVKILPHQQDRVRLFRTGHRGVGAARSLGLKAAIGKYIAYCDDDNEWKQNHLSTLFKYLIENPEISLVYGDSQWVQEGIHSSSVPNSCDYESC